MCTPDIHNDPVFHVLYLSMAEEIPIAVFRIEKDLEDFCLMRFNVPPSGAEGSIGKAVKYYVF